MRSEYCSGVSGMCGSSKPKILFFLSLETRHTAFAEDLLHVKWHPGKTNGPSICWAHSLSRSQQLVISALPVRSSIISAWPSILLSKLPVSCSVTSLLLTLISSTYRSQLVAELFGYGRQTSYAVLAIAAFICGCTFVHVRPAPSQQPVNKSSQLPGGSEDRNVSAAALRHLSIVGSEGRLAVAQGERRHTQSG